MKARMPAGFGRPDMNSLMRQAQKMQEDMKAKQAELEAAEYTGSASGEMVTVKMNGKHEVLSITIKPEAVDPDDIEMLEDLVAAAVNATVKQVDETAEAEMGKLTGGLNIPGLWAEGRDPDGLSGTEHVGSGCRRTGGCDPERPHQAPPLPCLPELYRSRALPHLCQCQAGPLCHLCGGNAP